MIELIILGTFIGMVSGFFGIGGGTVLIPLLLLLGYDTKVAIGISVIQMVFSSTYGSYINQKKGNLDTAMVFTIGVGGFIGALFSGVITSTLDNKALEIIFLFFALFALLKMFFHTVEHKDQRDVNRPTLFSIGFILGAISMSIGVGGSLLLVPILVGFLHIELKKAISAGLFFVVFSSISGLISHSISEHMDFQSGIIIGVSSLLGVYIGIHMQDKVSSLVQKRLLVGFYLSVVIYLANRIF